MAAEQSQINAIISKGVGLKKGSRKYISIHVNEG